VRQGAADPDVAKRLFLRYSGFWDARSGIVASYLAVPMRTENGRTLIACLDAAVASHSDATMFDIDCRTLEAAVADLAVSVESGRQYLLGVPIAASTLLRPKLRTEYMALWRAKMGDSLAKRVRCYCYHIPDGAGVAQLQEIAAAMRQLGRAPIVNLPPKASLVPFLSGLGIFGAGIDYDLWSRRLGPLEFERRLSSVVKKAHAASLSVFLTNVWDGAGVMTGFSFGCDFIAVRWLGGVGDIPTSLAREDAAALADALDREPAASAM
jgi:hypothetical protein